MLNDDGSCRSGTFRDEEGEAAVAAAVSALAVALSLDYRALDKSVSAALAMTTPEFGKTYTETFDSTRRAMATQKEAITSARVRGPT